MYRSILITGTNHGLGLSLAKCFLDNQDEVFAGVYHPEESAQIYSFLQSKHLHTFSLDIADTESVRKAAVSVGKLTNKIDILINNAGMIPLAEIEEERTIFDPLDFDAVNQAINTNAVGSLRVTNFFMPLLREGREKLVVNISSEAGSIAGCERVSWFGYCMSKAALNMSGALIHNSLRSIYGQVWQIHPGWMQTYMSGKKNFRATYTPDFSAERIFELTQNFESYFSEKCVYMDLFGTEMEW